MKLIPAYKKAFARFEQRMLPFGEYALPGLDAYRYRFGKGLAILHLHLPVGSLQDVVGDGDAIAMTQQRKDTAS